MSDLEQLLAREAIRDLVARYNSNGDAGRFEPLEELFAEHAVMELVQDGVTDLYEGRAAVMTIFNRAKAKTGARTAAAAPAYVRHTTSTHQIDLIDADHATGRCYFSVIVSHGLDHWGRYIDRYVRDTDSRWRFEHRKVQMDGVSGESWFATS
jgi:SnoaL-like domain